MTCFSYASTRERDIFYIMKMDIHDPFFLLEKDGKALVFLDSREIGFFEEKNEQNNLKAIPLEPFYSHIRKQQKKRIESSHLIAAHILKTYVGNGTIEVPAYFPLDMADFLRRNEFRLKVLKPFVPQRSVKTKTEATAVRLALKKTQKAFKTVEKILKGSVIKGKSVIYRGAPLTSEILRKAMDKALASEGMFNSEGSIISSGIHASMPHHPGSGAIKAGLPIICDLFPVDLSSGYFADMTRTYVKGKPSKRLNEMYEAVREAGEKAMSLVKPGVPVRDIHEAVCKILVGKGFDVGDKGFTHATGHGLGLEVHEAPTVTASSSAVLEEGNIITIEPGLYYAKDGGVRIEDVALVTKKGHENMTRYPKRFVIP